MSALVERAMGSRRTRGQTQSIQRFLNARNIVSVEVVKGADYDGMIEPVGSTFSDGFRMRLKTDVSEVRGRFTVAHEACHTFFYELVPELKFGPHETDQIEERLCNFGASALLVPAASLRTRTRNLPISVDSLEAIASEYAVSLPTMLLRLRSLGLWRCEFSLWHRTSTGDFVLHRLYGGRKAEWKWQDSSSLKRVWASNKPVFGTGFVYLENRGAKAYKPVAYHVRRFNSGLAVLWGEGVKPTPVTYPLLEAARI